MTIDVERRLTRVLNYFGWSPPSYGDALAAKFIERLAEERLVIAAEYGTPASHDFLYDSSCPKCRDKRENSIPASQETTPFGDRQGSDLADLREALDLLARYLWDGDTGAGGDEEFVMLAYDKLAALAPKEADHE